MYLLKINLYLFKRKEKEKGILIADVKIPNWNCI